MTNTSTATCSASPDRPNAELVPETTPVSAMANSSSGKARNTFIIQLMTVSTQPPKYPATTPMMVPMTTEITVAVKEISSEYSEPTSTRESMSRPYWGST